jgi:hypothetical protein
MGLLDRVGDYPLRLMGEFTMQAELAVVITLAWLVNPRDRKGQEGGERRLEERERSQEGEGLQGGGLPDPRRESFRSEDERGHPAAACCSPSCLRTLTATPLG